MPSPRELPFWSRVLDSVWGSLAVAVVVIGGFIGLMVGVLWLLLGGSDYKVELSAAESANRVCSQHGGVAQVDTLNRDSSAVCKDGTAHGIPLWVDHREVSQ